MDDRTPITPEDARARLRSTTLPDALRTVARTLHDAGHEVVVVGGAVRDCLLERPHGDWDLATSATPDEVMGLFRKTIPTGVEHGTVTVVQGRGERRVVVEVTTFRGDGEYHDGRRPSAVTFLRDLEGDLSRRDFTVNAFAWNPITAVFTDCFDGLADLARGVVRAVGDPAARFQEDGLRAMRAVRFCATLGFDLDPATHDAIGGALEILARVSRERVRVELIKLLAAPRPSRGLAPLDETGMWPVALGELGEAERAARSESIAACDRLRADPVLRLARLYWPARAERARIEASLEQLKPSKVERRRVSALTAPGIAALAALAQGPDLRRAAAALGREHVGDALELLEAPADARARLHAAIDGAPLTIGELAIGGRDLVAAGAARPGPALGDMLRSLLDWAMEEPARNEPAALLERARALGS
ncbi:MAG: tRNA cytidylyltransferase [Myxococcales bacterium]|nr:tRNA cytidylyltransferase [Myxococcales bacterium]